MAKMSEPGLSSQRIAAATGCSRNFVDDLIHRYNNRGIDSVLRISPKTGRPSRLKEHLEAVSDRLLAAPPRSSAEADDTIRSLSGQAIGLTWTCEIMRRCGLRFIRMQPIPGKASPEKQKEWVAEIQPIIKEASEGRHRLYFMDAVHFTPEASTCHVWCREPLYLKTGA